MAELDVLIGVPGASAELDLIVGKAVKSAMTQPLDAAARQVLWRQLGGPLVKRVDLSATVIAAQSGLATPTAYFAFTPPRPQTGRLWSVRKLVVMTSGGGGPMVPGALLPTSTDVTSSASGGNAINVATLPGVAGQTTFITGFEVTASGATVGLDVTVTVAGTISGSLLYTFTFPTGALVGATPLIVTFPRPIPASAANTAITVTVPAGGAGNTNASVTAHGFQQAGAGVLGLTGALYITGQPTSALANVGIDSPNIDADLTGITLPTTQFFSTHQLWVRGQDSLILGIQGSGVTTGLQVSGHVRVLEIDDSPELLTTL